MFLPLRSTPWEAEDKKEKDEKKDEKDFMPFEEDVYCNLALKLVQWHDVPADHEDPHVPFGPSIPVVHGILLWTFNCIFQCLIVCIVLLAAEHAEKPLEDVTFLSRHNHTRHEANVVLNEAVATGNPALPAWFDKSLEETCAVQMVPAFLGTSAWMTLLWIMVMVGEIKTCSWWFIFIANSPDPELPRRYQDEEADNEDDDDDDDEAVHLTLLETPDPSKPDELIIAALTCRYKAALMFVVPFVRLFLAVLLMNAGVKFIFVQTNLASAVLKVMTLKFVMTVDEVLIKALLTKYGDRSLKLAKIYSLGSRTLCWPFGTRTLCCQAAQPATGRHLAQLWERFGGMFWLVLAIALWMGFFWCLFGSEFLFRRACLSYHEAFPGAFGVHESYSIFGAIQLLWN